MKTMTMKTMKMKIIHKMTMIKTVQMNLKKRKLKRKLKRKIKRMKK